MSLSIKLKEELQHGDKKNILKVELLVDESQKVFVLPKRFVFTPRAVTWWVEHQVDNPTGVIMVPGREYRQLMRGLPGEKPAGSGSLYLHWRSHIHTRRMIRKISFEKMEENALSLLEVKVDGLPCFQHYFIGAWVRQKTRPIIFTPMSSPVGVMFLEPTSSVNLAQAAATSSPAVLLRVLNFSMSWRRLHQDWELTVDYGWLTVVAKPIFWLLGKFTVC